jgi:hypothetical protein
VEDVRPADAALECVRGSGLDDIRKAALGLARLRLCNLRLYKGSVSATIGIHLEVCGAAMYLLLRPIRDLELRVQHEHPAVRLQCALRSAWGIYRLRQAAFGRTISRE